MNYVLDLPIVSAIQYDGSIESKVEIENLLNDISVIIESSKGKCLLLQCPQNLNVTFIQIGDFIFEEPITKNIIVMKCEEFEKIASRV